MALEDGDGLSLLLHLLAPVILGTTVHFSVEPGARRWHRTLRKSACIPPPALFPIVWLSNYLCMGYASYLCAKAGAPRQLAAAYIGYQVLLNTWNPVFFALRRLGAALLIMLALDIVTPVLMMRVAAVAPLAAVIVVPYYMWLLLLTYLCYYMWMENPGQQFGITKEEAIRQHEAPLNEKED